MTTESLTDLLAERVLRWRIAPDRFLLSSRQWLPRWRFRPTERIEDAFRLLEAAAPQEYKIVRAQHGGCRVAVKIAGATGEARDRSTPLAIALAIARAIGVDVA